MGVKTRSTQNGWQGGQERFCNLYCPTCHVFSEPHRGDCSDEKVQISATARIPRKNASKKVWDAFYRKFVLNEDRKMKDSRKCPPNPKRQFTKSKRAEILSFEKYNKEKPLEYLTRYENLLKRTGQNDKLKKCQNLIASKKKQQSP